jgi:hypothetical protein
MHYFNDLNNPYLHLHRMPAGLLFPPTLVFHYGYYTRRGQSTICLQGVTCDITRVYRARRLRVLPYRQRMMSDLQNVGNQYFENGSYGALQARVSCGAERHNKYTKCVGEYRREQFGRSFAVV